MAQIFNLEDEKRLRDLAHGIVRGIEEPKTVLNRLGFTSDDYEVLADTRAFRQMLGEAQSEWEGAGNTHKRIKLKAAVNIEEALPHFYLAMTDPKEPLSSKVKAFEVVSKVAGLGMNEPVAAGAGQSFNLQINLGAGVTPISLGAYQGESVTLEHEVTPGLRSGGLAADPPDLIRGRDEGRYSQSKLFDGLPLEEL
jgi:hypothetical protein